METRILGISEKDIQVAADILKTGGLVGFPTETVYGLGANAMDSEAVGKVYAAKGRPSDNPMIVHIAGEKEMERLTDVITPDMKRLMEAFWPGPLTMVVPARPEVPRVTTGGVLTLWLCECRTAAPLLNLSERRDVLWQVPAQIFRGIPVPLRRRMFMMICMGVLMQ